jgi:hypothetical protein
VSAEAARHLRSVDAATGEVLDSCPRCQDLEAQIAGAEKDIRAWRRRYAELARDRERDAKNHPLWDTAAELFGEWKLACRHPRSAWTVDRFETVAPLLEKYGVAMCRRAIAGAAFDPYRTTRRNGTEQRHDDFSLVFRDAGRLESFANRCPKGWTP